MNRPLPVALAVVLGWILACSGAGRPQLPAPWSEIEGLPVEGTTIEGNCSEYWCRLDHGEEVSDELGLRYVKAFEEAGWRRTNQWPKICTYELAKKGIKKRYPNTTGTMSVGWCNAKERYTHVTISLGTVQ